MFTTDSEMDRLKGEVRPCLSLACPLCSACFSDDALTES